MNLRDQLKEILPGILPRNPAHAIKGTDLIEVVNARLKQSYSDATLRYHFSIMSCDPSSPIAKVEQGQGYYLRSTTIHSLHSARNLITASQGMLGEEFALSSSDADLSLDRANKFRAVVQRYFESVHTFPLAFERSFSDEHALANRWRFPDMVSIDWLVGDLLEDGSFALSRKALETRRRLGEAPFRVSSVKLKLEITHDSLLEDLHQTLSVSGWANNGEMMVAAPIDDERMVELIRQFSTRYGVGVTSFGLTADVLDDLPEPAAIDNLMPREFEAIQSLFRMRRISSSRMLDRFDWNFIVENRHDNEDFALLAHWLTECLHQEKVIPVEDFTGDRQTQAPGDSAAPASPDARENVA